MDDRRHPAPMSIDRVLRPQPRPVRLTSRGEWAVLLGVLALLTALAVASWLFPIYVVVGSR